MAVDEDASENPDGFDASDFEDLIRARLTTTRHQLAQLNIFDGLTPEKADQLTRLVLQISSAHATSKQFPPIEDWLRKDEKAGAGQRRMFISKVQEALVAVEDVMAYVSKVNKGERNPLLARAMQKTLPQLQTAKHALASILTVPRVTVPMNERFSDRAKSAFRDQAPFATQELTAFFAGSGLRKNEGDRRTALIGNALGWWAPVSVDDEYEGGDAGAKGSSTIRKRRTRQSKQDTFRKTRR